MLKPLLWFPCPRNPPSLCPPNPFDPKFVVGIKLLVGELKLMLINMSSMPPLVFIGCLNSSDTLDLVKMDG